MWTRLDNNVFNLSSLRSRLIEEVRFGFISHQIKTDDVLKALMNLEVLEAGTFHHVVG
jgi:hypothetical protein